MKKPVSGTAMGLISEKMLTNYAILSDIYDKDHLGDMDLQVNLEPAMVSATQMDESNVLIFLRNS